MTETASVQFAGVDAASDNDAADVRYFTLSNIQAHSSEEGAADTVRKATAKLINSLSSTNRVIDPAVLGQGGSLLKIRLRDYGWNAERWETLAAGHPEASDAAIQGLGDLKTRTGTRKPVLRAEYFVKQASQPPLYYQLLGLPANTAGLQSILEVNIAANIQNGQVMRAGLNNSLVSSNHRVIERHKTSYGVLWQSYEFGTKTGNQNIFSAPLGPGGGKSSGGVLGGLFGGGGDQFAFASDGNEFIFNLPNGLFAFYIADAAGKRLDKVPGVTKGPQITPGAVCMSCHAQGFIDTKDQVRKTVAGAGQMSGATERVNKLYVEQGVLSQQIAADSELFNKALKALNIDGARDGDPVSKTLAMPVP